MSNDFKTLIGFLDQFGPEVSGKAMMAPYGEDADRLHRFASGLCNEEERTRICEMLRLHPAWLRWLADRVKMARDTAGGAH